MFLKVIGPPGYICTYFYAVASHHCYAPFFNRPFVEKNPRVSLIKVEDNKEVSKGAAYRTKVCQETNDIYVFIIPFLVGKYVTTNFLISNHHFILMDGNSDFHTFFTCHDLESSSI